MRRQDYPGDVTDEGWGLVAPYLTLMIEDAPPRGIRACRWHHVGVHLSNYVDLAEDRLQAAMVRRWRENNAPCPKNDRINLSNELMPGEVDSRHA